MTEDEVPTQRKRVMGPRVASWATSKVAELRVTATKETGTERARTHGYASGIAATLLASRAETAAGLLHGCSLYGEMLRAFAEGARAGQFAARCIADAFEIEELAK